MGWSAVCECGTSRSYSRTFLVSCWFSSQPSQPCHVRSILTSFDDHVRELQYNQRTQISRDSLGKITWSDKNLQPRITD